MSDTDSTESLDSYRLISDRTIAKKYGMSVATVRRWAHDGLVDRVKLPGSDGYLVSGPQVEAILLASVVKAGTTENDHETSNDPLFDFLRRFTIPDTGKVVSSTLYQAYDDWCDVMGLESRSKQMFGRLLNDMGHTTSKPGGVTYKNGLRMLTPEEVEQRDRAGVRTEDRAMDDPKTGNPATDETVTGD